MYHQIFISGDLGVKKKIGGNLGWVEHFHETNALKSLETVHKYATKSFK